MLRVDRIRFNPNFFGSQAGSPEQHVPQDGLIAMLHWERVEYGVFTPHVHRRGDHRFGTGGLAALERRITTLSIAF